MLLECSASMGSLGGLAGAPVAPASDIWSHSFPSILDPLNGHPQFYFIRSVGVDFYCLRTRTLSDTASIHIEDKRRSHHRKWWDFKKILLSLPQSLMVISSKFPFAYSDESPHYADCIDLLIYSKLGVSTVSNVTILKSNVRKISTSSNIF